VFFNSIRAKRTRLALGSASSYIASVLWRPSRPVRSRSKPLGFILRRQPGLADRPPSGPGWLHEIKFDRHRVIARKDGDRVRLWARAMSD
jgi:ATP-dependent DNA ligase